DHPIKARVASAIHLAHPACSERRHDFIRAQPSTSGEWHGVRPDFSDRGFTTKGEIGLPLARHPGLSARLPADQRAPERQKRLMDVGPFVVADAQTPKLIEPGKRPLDDPPPAPQATAMRRAAPRDEGYYPPVSQSLSDRRRIVPAVRDHAQVFTDDKD